MPENNCETFCTSFAFRLETASVSPVVSINRNPLKWLMRAAPLQVYQVLVMDAHKLLGVNLEGFKNL